MWNYNLHRVHINPTSKHEILELRGPLPCMESYFSVIRNFLISSKQRGPLQKLWISKTALQSVEKYIKPPKIDALREACVAFDWPGKATMINRLNHLWKWFSVCRDSSVIILGIHHQSWGSGFLFQLSTALLKKIFSWNQLASFVHKTWLNNQKCLRLHELSSAYLQRPRQAFCLKDG